MCGGAPSTPTTSPPRERERERSFSGDPLPFEIGGDDTGSLSPSSFGFGGRRRRPLPLCITGSLPPSPSAPLRLRWSSTTTAPSLCISDSIHPSISVRPTQLGTISTSIPIRLRWPMTMNAPSLHHRLPPSTPAPPLDTGFDDTISTLDPSLLHIFGACIIKMKIMKLMPMDAAESPRLIDWMDKGVYDALQKKYLRILLFCLCEEVDGRMIDE